MSLLGKNKGGHVRIPTNDPDYTTQTGTSETDFYDVNIPLKKDNRKSGDKSITFGQWIIKNPFTKGKFAIFVVAFVLSVVFACLYGLGLYDYRKIYYVLTIIGIIVCMVGISNFRILMQLINEIDMYSKLNIKFKNANIKLKAEVNNLKEQNNELNVQQHNISAGVIKLQKQKKNLVFLNHKMGELNVQNLTKLNEILKLAVVIHKKWTEKLIETDRGLILEVFYHIMDKYKNTGMTAEIYNNEFLKRLPARYVIKLFHCGTFDYIAGGQKVIKVGDFALFLDELADMISNNEITKKFNIAGAKKRRSNSSLGIHKNIKGHKRKYTCLSLTHNTLSMEELRQHKTKTYYNNANEIKQQSMSISDLDLKDLILSISHQ